MTVAVSWMPSGSGGDGFFLACVDFGKYSTIPRLRFFFSFFFFEEEISSRSLIPLFTPGSVHSGSASWGDCGRMFPDNLR